MEDETLHRELGSAESAVLEETAMFQTDSRDMAADREAEEQEHFARTQGTWKVTADFLQKAVDPGTTGL